MRPIATCLFASIFTLFLTAQDTPLLHYPALNPDGSQLAFSYQGDIWTVPTTGGAARRLTIHESYEWGPQWSPDGTQIAFAGNRFGNDDIYTIAVNGGTPKRLTQHSASDGIPKWINDNELLFSTRRLYAQVERDAEVYRISTTGGTPQRALDAMVRWPNPSPSGRFIAYVEGSCREEREAYTGPARRDIWLYDTQNDSYQPLVENKAQDTQPQWGNEQTLYYLSAVGGKYNIYRQALDANGTAQGPPAPLTNQTEFGIRYFDVSANGERIVFESGDQLYTFFVNDPASPQVVNIQVTGDDRFDPVEQKTLTKRATEMALSSNEEQLLFSARGELFVMNNDKEKSRAVRLTNHPFRDIDVTWLNDSTALFRSDRNGNYDLYLLRSRDADETNLYKTLRWEERQLTNTPVDESGITLSPDGSRIAIQRGRGQLVVADISETGAITNEMVMLDGWETPSGICWSPDGQWLAYSLENLDFNEEIYIHRVASDAKPVNVSMHPRSDYSPYWSADGSKLGFVSQRNDGDTDLWFAWLKQADYDKTQRDWEYEEDEEEDEDAIPADSITVIDLEDIHYRLAQVTRVPGNEDDLVISPDGETFFFTTNNGSRSGSPGGSKLMSVKWDGEDLETLKDNVKVRTMDVDKEGKYLYVLNRGGTFSKVKIDGGKTENLAFSAKMKVNHYEEHRQVFDEAWRSLRDGFYDPNFHGQDWNALRKKYEPIALRASTEQDFRRMFNEMLGQLNASHMGLYGGNPEDTQRDRTGLLGVEVEPLDEGVRVTRVVRHSPADRDRSRLAVGEVILSINNETISRSTNMYVALNGTANERTLLEVRAADGSTRDVVIRPARSLRTELYEEWVADRKRLTDQYSNGRLGYIHIRGMNWTSFERFERELTASGLGKDGVVIDVRYNGGGWTTDMLMTVMNVRQHAYTVPRGAAKDLAKEHPNFANHYPYGERLPYAALTKPSVALCNQNSYSNAEIFSHAFKTLGHGTLVGMPTFGAVISTGGKGLLNGSFVRMPFRGWYVKATGQNMEFDPAVPDVILENAPNHRALDQDAQLEKAVEVLLREME
ncbi:MAG: S41 family peptidase [Bacteroidota bacterium]